MTRQGLLNSEWCGFSKRDTVNQLCDLALKGLSSESSAMTCPEDGSSCSIRICLKQGCREKAERSTTEKVPTPWTFTTLKTRVVVKDKNERLLFVIEGIGKQPPDSTWRERRWDAIEVLVRLLGGKT